VDPTGAPAGSQHVERGGSFDNPAEAVHAAHRYWGAEDHSAYALGFRCAADY
jgi:formylglycine-generating enzyme required for sulfatase activity